MDDNRRDTSDYAPNFVLRDEPEATAEEANANDTTSETFRENNSQPTNGSFRDPRDNFRTPASERPNYTYRSQTSEEPNYNFGSQTSEKQDYGFHRPGSEPADYSYTGSYGTYRSVGSDPQSAENDTQNHYYDAQTDYTNTQTDNGYSYGSDPETTDSKPVKKKKAKKPSAPLTLTRRALAILIALILVASAAFGLGGAYLGNNLFGSSNGSSKKASASTSGYTLEDATGSNMTVEEVTEATKDSVVEIKTESVSSDTWMQQYVTEGAGSGVIITNDGYIITNNHVIDGASKITVTTSDEKEYSAELVGTDSITDVAVLKIDAKNLTPATYGNSDQLAVGDMAVVIGNPLGELGGTVTYGIISALDRELSIDGKTMTLLQTDASVNPGNSGGGLFNGDGQLVGIVVAKSSGSDVEGLGFAIPINKAADVAQQLMDKGYVSGQPSTGMSYSESSQGSSMSQFFGQSESESTQSTATVYIQEVTGTNAKKAGFQQGDIVYAVDDTEITSFNELSSIVTSHEVGDKLTYTIVRNGQTMKIKLKLEEKKGDSN